MSKQARTAKDVCRDAGISEATYNQWKQTAAPKSPERREPSPEAEVR
ncbi:hypothetical protein EHW66_10555 [Erwinia psidii]|uniref:IS3 family transposase n=1 Tax=Erwinia psidii TaxID=69224 RepID=A0A3N6UX79_9GAMM|nr:hypothetical protein [Erwinia psidii]MCX8961836.1 hypothetical protein [Erwinia psidii]MCX8965430.1 hypothetical protein [Erwinia psidii]RQM37445.1 hypothetical protein EB241_14375 [Erwinia psidii]